MHLTDEQVLAAAAPDRLVNIVSAPGSGKTTVAALRIGHARFNRGDGRGVLGLTFNNAASAELRDRVKAHWGAGALSYPHRVVTFDHLYVDILHMLLMNGHIRWPNGRITLDIRDDYRGLDGFGYLVPNQSWERRAGLDTNGTVVSKGVRITEAGRGIGVRAKHEAALGAGVASYADVRWILRDAMTMTGFKERIVDWLVSNFRSIVIDEVYDGDALDLAVAFEAANMGLPVTLIGDPWQAIYRWRGATPELVDRLTASTSDPFVVYALTRSFRFEGAQMPALAADLRNGSPVDLPPISSLDVDVALARRWRDLWQVGDNVLPLAFRTVENATDAAINLLLDEVTRSRLGLNSFGRDGAIAKLKLDRESFLLVQSGLMQPLLDDLVSGVDAASVLEALRDAIRTLGVRRPGRLPTPAKEAILVQQVRLLSQRLFRDDLIAGLTVFQAKGREWPRVGVALSSSQQAMLLAGLREPAEDQCIIYVALTRARRRCGHLASTAQQAGDTPAVAARVSAATSRS